jgi:hypothetical protein
MTLPLVVKKQCPTRSGVCLEGVVEGPFSWPDRFVSNGWYEGMNGLLPSTSPPTVFVVVHAAGTSMLLKCDQVLVMK